MFTMFIASAFHLMDWNVLYFPYWTLNASFVGTAVGILYTTNFMQTQRHCVC